MSEGSDISISAWFWNPEIWLPPNVTWKDFQEEGPLSDPGLKLPFGYSSDNHESDGEFAKFNDLLYPLPMAVLMMVARYFVEKYIFTPIGLRLGMRASKRSYPRSNTFLESEFRKNMFPSHETVQRLSTETNLTEIEVDTENQ